MASLDEVLENLPGAQLGREFHTPADPQGERKQLAVGVHVLFLGSDDIQNG